MSTLDYWRVYREPWQPACDKCGGELVQGECFYTRKRSPYKLICTGCYQTKVATVRAYVALHNDDEPNDPRYA